MKNIYLDYNATTPVRAEVLEAMLPYYTQHFGNPSSIHWAGRAVSGALEKAREQVAALLSAPPADIVFTSCGSEGNNFALKGLARAAAHDKKHLISTVVEHPSVLETCRALQEQGWQVTYLPVNAQGQLNLADLEAAITPQTSIISIMGANNETGVIFPLAEIGALARQHQIQFHSDIVQAVGKVPVDVVSLQLDLAVISGHKFGAPKGVGAIYIKGGSQLEPLIHGGHQEKNRRAGTYNVAGIVGLGMAAELCTRQMDGNVKRICEMRDRLANGLFAKLAGLSLNGTDNRNERLPNTLNVSFSAVESESLLMNLDLKGIAASSGSACSSGSLEPSHVIAAMGVDPALARSSIRFSLGPGNCTEEIDYVLEVLPPIVERLRQMSPL